MSGSTSAIASASSVVIDANNRIVVVGSERNGSNADIVLARYTSTGRLDLSFGTGGKAIFPIGSGGYYGRNVAIDGSGRIVVSGFSDIKDNSYSNFLLTRYTNTGILDETFGTSGRVVAPMTLDEDWGVSMAIDTNDRIVLADYSYSINPNFSLTRYTSTGILDGTFGTSGKVISSIGAGKSYPSSVVIDASDRIVVAGTANNGIKGDFGLPRGTVIDGLNSDFALARYTNKGALDPSFGTGGIVISPIGTGNDAGRSVAIDASGKIIVAGNVAPNFSDRSNFALARYTSAGILDSSFGIGGTVISTNLRGIGDSVALDANGRIVANSVAIDANGRIVVGGYYVNNFSSRTSDVALARYTSAGILDSSFGTGGIVISPIIDGGGIGTDLAIDANDRIVVVGYSADGSNNGFTVARYNGGPNNFTFKADTFTRNVTIQSVENFYIDPATQLQARRNLTYGSSFGALAGQTIKLSSDWTIAAIADFNRDGIDDMLLHNQLGDAVELWTLGANAQVTAIQSIVGQDGNTLKTGNTNWHVVGFADSDRDGILDIVWRNQQSDEVAFWFMANDGRTVKTYDYLRNSDGTITKTNNPLWQIAAVADFDRDGNIDLLFRLPELNQTAIVRTNGKTLVDALYITANPDMNLQIRGIADSNGDSIPDIYWQSPDKRQVLVQAMKFQAGKWLADDFALANPIVPVAIAA
jgi:uncharacterized delta-60 repeat protein